MLTEQRLRFDISRLPSPFRQGHASKGGPAAAAAASSTPCKETALSTAQLNARNSRAAAAAATAAAPAPVASTGDKSRSHGNQQNNNVAAWNTGKSLVCGGGVGAERSRGGGLSRGDGWMRRQAVCGGGRGGGGVVCFEIMSKFFL